MSMDELDPRWNGASIDKDHWHFHSRLLCRYGITLAPGEFSGIRKAIAAGQTLILSNRSRASIHCVKIKSAGKLVLVLAAGTRPLTAWPPDKGLFQRRKALLRSRAAATEDAYGPTAGDNSA